MYLPDGPDTMPQIVVESGDIVSQNGFTRPKIISKSEVPLIQAQSEKILVRGLYFRWIGVSSAPQQ